MSARAILTAALVALSTSAYAQGFAGLGQAEDGFLYPDPDTRFQFPADHGAHPGFRIEWWYMTANLTGDDGQSYGIQWTLFRNALAPDLDTDNGAQIWMAHAGLTTPDTHFAAERFARGGAGLAGVTPQPFEAFLDEWRMAGPSLSDVTVFAQGPDFAFDLSFDASGPFVPQGRNGYSVKAETGQASHYYSQPFYAVAGTLTLPSGDVTVTGNGWLDREWSSAPLAQTQTGWDWVSLHFDSGDKLMGFRLRDAEGEDYATGTWITADGTPTPLSPGDLQMSAIQRSDVDGRDIPTVWRIALPAQDIDVEISAVNTQSYMDVSVPYWEGPVTVIGSHPGVGYLEMTGYD